MKSNARIRSALAEAGITEQELAAHMDLPNEIMSELLGCDKEEDWRSRFGIDPSEVFVATARLTHKDLYWLAHGK